MVKFQKGLNDVYTTHNYLVKYFEYEEDSKNVTYSSHKKIRCKCPICGYKKVIRMADLYRNGLSCICSDGKSYPEKYVACLLRQLKIDFDSEKKI